MIDNMVEFLCCTLELPNLWSVPRMKAAKLQSILRNDLSWMTGFVLWIEALLLQGPKIEIRWKHRRSICLGTACCSLRCSLTVDFLKLHFFLFFFFSSTLLCLLFFRAFHSGSSGLEASKLNPTQERLNIRPAVWHIGFRIPWAVLKCSKADGALTCS